jgi:2-oxoglutarate dehydrogenase complex dehydrogenase (E1) component-like enzyme
VIQSHLYGGNFWTSSFRVEYFRGRPYTLGRNLIIANLTTPARIFHLLRRQAKQMFRKPLILYIWLETWNICHHALLCLSVIAQHKNQRQLQDVNWIALLGRSSRHISVIQERPLRPS